MKVKALTTSLSEPALEFFIERKLPETFILAVMQRGGCRIARLASYRVNLQDHLQLCVREPKPARPISLNALAETRNPYIHPTLDAAIPRDHYFLYIVELTAYLLLLRIQGPYLYKMYGAGTSGILRHARIVIV